MKILITGAKGQLAQSLFFKKPNNHNVIMLDRNALDLSNKLNCKFIISKHKPNWIINCGAYTNVELAQKNRNHAMSVNSDGPMYLAQLLKDHGGKLIHFSTDYVFDGTQSIPYKYNHKINPLNIYGISKGLGEKAVMKLLGPTNQIYILRTSWLMGPFGNNFIYTMLNLHKNKEEIDVVTDQVSCPTNSISLAEVCWKLIEKENLKKSCEEYPKILHWSDAGVASWYDISEAIGEIALEIGLLETIAKVNPIKTSKLKLLARRPHYSLLDSSKTFRLLNVNQIHWRKNLKRILLKIKNDNALF